MKRKYKVIEVDPAASIYGAARIEDDLGNIVARTTYKSAARRIARLLNAENAKRYVESIP